MAKAYKRFGILDKKKGSNSYWPVDFTDRGGLALEGEGYLGFEKLIILKRHMKSFQWYYHDKSNINYKTYIIICKVVFGSMSFSIGLLRLLRFISSFCIVFHFHPELSTFWRSMYLFRRIFSLVLTLIFRFNMNFPSVDFLDFGFMRLVFSFIQRLRKFFCFQSWGLCFLFTNRSPNTHIYLFPWWKPLQFYAAIL